MKRKLFLAFFIVAMLACIFAISANAEEISTLDYDRTYTLDGVSYPLWEQDSEGGYHPLIWYLNSEKQMCSVWADGQANAEGTYVSLGCYENQLSKMTVYESNGATYTSDLSFVIVNLNGVELTYNGTPYDLKYIHFKAFHTNTAAELNIYYNYAENNTLKAVFLPNTLNHIGWHGKSLIQADNTAFYSFDNCTALEYVEFHKDTVLDDNTINRGAFSLCSSLKAISLPDNITTIGGSAFKNCTSMQAIYLPSALKTVNITDRSHTFEGCTSMYFVNEPFTMSSITQIPQKPDVYYFPSNMTVIPVLSSNCNETVIIGTGVTSHVTGVYANSGVKTVVYLGNMTSFGFTKAQSTKLNVLMPNTTSEPTVSANGNNFSDSAVYLCKLNKSFVFDEKAWKDETVHFEDSSKSVITKEATCADNAMKDTTCFCGKYIGEVYVEGTSGTGQHNLENAKAINIVYSDFTKDGIKTIQCAKCGADDITDVADALFACTGYSAPEDGRGGIAIGFTVNNEAIDEYISVTGKTLKYGVFAVLQKRLGDNEIMNADGSVADGVINAEISSYGFASFELKIVGFETEEHKSAKIAMGAYVFEVDEEATSISYLQSGTPNENESYCFASYNDVVAVENEVTQ